MYRRYAAIYISAAAVLCLFMLLPLFNPVLPANRELSAAEPVFYTDFTDALSVSAARSVLFEASGGNILFGNREYEKAEIASTTKIMTALVVLENIEITEKVRIPKEATGVEGSSIYLAENEVLTVEELLYGLMLASGNDCAVALAIACAGSVEEFVGLMNEKAAELGLENTHFANPHGLPAEDHYATAFSLAAITAEALKNRDFKRISSSKNKYIPYNGAENGRYLYNHNRLLRTYDGMIGGKTGFTKSSGRCLVTAAERDGLILVAVTLNDPGDWQSHKNMLDYGFSQYKSVLLAESGQYGVKIPVVGSEKQFITAINQDSVRVCLKNDVGFTYEIAVPNFLYAPFDAGQRTGHMIFKRADTGEVIASLPLFSTEGAEYKKVSFFKKIFG